MWTLVVSAFGRPRRTGTAANFARYSGEDRSGASSGSVQSGAVTGLFSGIGFSQADDAAATRFPVAARGPDGYDHASVEAADGDETWLAIVSAIVRDGQRRSCENLASARHIESAIVDDRLAFGGVEFDLQVIIVATKYAEVNAPVPDRRCSKGAADRDGGDEEVRERVRVVSHGAR